MEKPDKSFSLLNTKTKKNQTSLLVSSNTLRSFDTYRSARTACGAMKMCHGTLPVGPNPEQYPAKTPTVGPIPMPKEDVPTDSVHTTKLAQTPFDPKNSALIWKRK